MDAVADGVLARLVRRDWFERAAGLAFRHGALGGAAGLQDLRGTRLRRLQVGLIEWREGVQPEAFASPDLASVRELTLQKVPVLALWAGPLGESVEALSLEVRRGETEEARGGLPALRSLTVRGTTPEEALGSISPPPNLSGLTVNLEGTDDDAGPLARWTRAAPLRTLSLSWHGYLSPSLLCEMLPAGLFELRLWVPRESWSGLPARVADAAPTLRHLCIPELSFGPAELRALGDSPALTGVRRLSLTLDGDPQAIGRAWRESFHGWAIEGLSVRLASVEARGRFAAAGVETWLPVDAPALSALRRLTLANVELRAEELARLASIFPVEFLSAPVSLVAVSAWSARLPSRLRCVRLDSDLRKRCWDGWAWRPPFLVRTG